jgi:hypothetical protein
MVTRGFINLGTLAQSFLVGREYGAWPLGLLLGIGVLASVWTRERAPSGVLLLLVLGAAAAPLMTQIHVFQERYGFILVPLTVVWAAGGVVTLAGWGSVLLARRGVPAAPRRAAAALGCAAAVAALAVVFSRGFDSIGTFLFDAGDHAAATREAGDWLHAQPGNKVVMDTETTVAYHAAAQYVPMPCSSGATALRYADSKSVQYIVLRDWSLHRRPFLETWFEGREVGERAELVHSSGSDPGSRVLVYRLAPAPAAESAVRR